ncbi:MAG TPA: EAL domain-containing protein [Nocardioidaceae bacterium]
MSAVRSATETVGLIGRLGTAPGPLAFVAVGLSYLTLTQLAMSLQGPGPQVPVLWPAAGLSLAALMLLPTDRWIWALGAIALAELAGDVAWGYSVAVTFGWILSSAVLPLVGAVLLRRFGNPSGSLVPARQLVLFLGFGVVVGPVAGSFIAAGVSALARFGEFPTLWSGYFVGDALGVLVLTPLLVARPAGGPARPRRELTALVLSTTLACTAVFTDFGGSWIVTMPYVIVPFFAWAALRFGTFGTACLSLGVTVLAGAFTAMGQGPFALAGGPEGAAVTLLQVFLAITVSFSLLLAALVSDLSDRRHSEETLRHQAMHDTLTGLANRCRFTEAIEAALAVPGELGRGTGLLVCDLDLFKTVNDRVGHKGGDDLLVQVAERLRTSVRDEDLVARISGDEFVVLLAEVDEADAEGVARRLADVVAQPVLLDRQREVRPSISIGAAVAEPGEGADSLFRVADAALYQAKRRGRGRVVVADGALRDQARAQVRVEDDVRAALAAQQITCHFQPVVDLASGRLAGAEATVRWRHADLGLLDAERFLPTVEAMGLGDRLLETVLVQSLRAQMRWAGAAGGCPPVSVNVSALQLGSGAVLNMVLHALAETDAPAEALCLEVNGIRPLDDLGAATLHQLHALGVHLVLDGFGTGGSSVKHLAGIPWDQLKIDRSLVAELGADPAAADTARAILAMARALGIRTGADGVAQIGQLDTLVALGCDLAQGPLLSRPESAEELGRMLTDDRVWLDEDIRRVPRPVPSSSPGVSGSVAGAVAQELPA